VGFIARAGHRNRSTVIVAASDEENVVGESNEANNHAAVSVRTSRRGRR
jgi:hypothetical protein